jgi:phenylalanyl-tRNA synthetase beta chain
MRVSLSWLRDWVDLPAGLSPRAVAAGLIRVGLEVETVEELDVDGPLVLGRVVSFEEETHSNGKTIRWCSVDVGPENPDGAPGRGIVCGARNFDVGDLVVVALPGAVLPGGFAIARRRTYGHESDGMICSVRELGVGDDHTGILVLAADEVGDAKLGDDARGLVGLPDAVLDIAVTPDRGYALSMRGVGREAAAAFGVPMSEPQLPVALPSEDGPGWPVRIEDATACDRFVARTVRDVDPRRASPLWLQRRLHLAGMRSVSLLVDVTNHVMLDLGEPTHGYDADRLTGPIVVRRAAPGERLVTLDDQDRALHPDDLVIADDTGAIGLAGLMGGATTEMGPTTTTVVIEAAHFEPVGVARASRRHRLSSEASRRFERGADPALPRRAADAVAAWLVHLGGGSVDAGVTDVDLRAEPPTLSLPVTLAGRLGGLPVSQEAVVDALQQVGCAVHGPDDAGVLAVVPPSWRPDLVGPEHLVEEVLRLVGYDRIPSRVPRGPASRAGAPAQGRRVLRITRALAYAGAVEVRSDPFVGQADLDVLGIEGDDPRSRLVRLVNPMSDDRPLLRTTLLPGLLTALRRNLGRGLSDLALFEVGRVFQRESGAVRAPLLPVDRAPTAAELAALDAHLPHQPLLVAAVACQRWVPDSVWGPGRDVAWPDAIELARRAGAAVDAVVRPRQAHQPPWHPGRCAALVVPDGRTSGDPVLAGFAGELHPRVVAALGLPPRTVAMELDLTVLLGHATPLDQAVHPSTYPPATQDVALVVADAVAAADVQDALVDGAGPLLESIRLFDRYAGAPVPAGHVSLAFTLTFRAPDRTLTDTEVARLREAAVAAASHRTAAVLRSS